MHTAKIVMAAGFAGLLTMAVYAGYRAIEDDEGLRAQLTVDRALQLALEKVSGFAMHAETEKEGSSVNWCVVIADSAGKVYEVEIDGASGKVLEVEEENDEGPAMSASTSMMRAIEIARERTPGYVTEAELENEKNALVWGVEIIASDNKLYEVEMNANSGQVLRVALESDDDDGGVAKRRP